MRGVRYSCPAYVFLRPPSEITRSSSSSSSSSLGEVFLPLTPNSPREEGPLPSSFDCEHGIHRRPAFIPKIPTAAVGDHDLLRRVASAVSLSLTKRAGNFGHFVPHCTSRLPKLSRLPATAGPGPGPDARAARVLCRRVPFNLEPLSSATRESCLSSRSYYLLLSPLQAGVVVTLSLPHLRRMDGFN